MGVLHGKEAWVVVATGAKVAGTTTVVVAATAAVMAVTAVVVAVLARRLMPQLATPLNSHRKFICWNALHI
jgi:hypothetical protein